MTTHTPGPWEVHIGEALSPIYRGIVALIEHSPDGQIAVLAERRGTHPEEWKANAHVIAAAPDLKHAAEQNIDLLTGMSDFFEEGSHEHKCIEQRIRETRAAISKATA